MELRVVSHESGEGSYPMPLDSGEKWSGLQSLLRICQQRELSLGLSNLMTTLTMLLGNRTLTAVIRLPWLR